MGANQVFQARKAQLMQNPLMLASSQKAVMGAYPMRHFRQVNNLHEIIYTN